MNVGNKIKKLIGEGKKKTQAVAIALSMKEAAKKQKSKKLKQNERMVALGVRG